MNIALIGYGKMGHAIEAVAPERGHKIICTVDNDKEWHSKADELKEAAVAIEFSTPATAVDDIRRCFEMQLPIVCGTTGWYDHEGEIVAECIKRGASLFVASNFSIGMNIMFALNERLAELMNGRKEYNISITETHHIHKLDAPSGTAITLKKGIMEKYPDADVPVTSIREGEVPGTHIVAYDSQADTITITHEAHSRRGLAIGALLAAEFLMGKKGFYTMKDLLH